MPTTGLPTRLETILGQVTALYSAVTCPAGVSSDSVAALTGLLPLFPVERVYFTLSPDSVFAENPPCDQFLLIRPENFSAMSSYVAGGGNQTLGTDGSFSLTLWNRFEADLPMTDASSVSDATYGILAKWRACVAILSMFMPTDQTGNGLAIEPIRFAEWSTQQRGANSPWILLSSRWQCRFNQALS